MRTLKRLLLALTATVLGTWGLAMIWAYWPGEPEVPVENLLSADDRLLNVAGLRLRYREWGEPTREQPSLLLLHGFANSLQSFRELAPRLADRHHVVAIDMPGYGLSDKPVDYDYHNGPQADTIIAAARALGLSRVVYIGHSLGGAIALQAAIKDPDTAGLVLLNPGILSTGVPKIVQVTLPPLPRMSAKLFASRDFRGNFLRRSYVDPSIVTEQVIDDVMLGARSEGYMQGMTSLMQQYAEGEEIALAARVAVPTLIPWGTEDRNKPANEADALQQLIPGSQLIRVPDAGHYVHEEAAEDVAAAILAWLETIR
jgi:pimeloyl-ACP methyl ester carboxylesterase